MSESVSLAATVLDRIKEVEGIDKDRELALVLLSDPKNVSAWRNRGIMPWGRVVEYARTRQISLEWLINGSGPARRQDMVMEPGVGYRGASGTDEVCDIARDVYRATTELGTALAPDKFAEIVRLAHREMLDRSDPVPYAKIVALVKLAT